jgi:hypothetical protein
VRRLLLVAFFLEIGFVLVVVPWSTFWDRNYFAESVPTLQALITNNFVRGAVSGLGVVNILAGVWELVALLVSGRGGAAETPSITPRRTLGD